MSDGLAASFVQVLQRALEQIFKDSLTVTCFKCTILQISAAVDPAENSDYIIIKPPFYRLILIYLYGIYQKSWKKKFFRVNKPQYVSPSILCLDQKVSYGITTERKRRKRRCCQRV